MSSAQQLDKRPLQGFSRGLDRPRYFPRQVITPDDLTLEQSYFRDRMRRHNRLLHGFGVVCGALVTAAQEPWTVIISPGYLLGPYGDEISIDRKRCFDIRTRCITGVEGDPCPEPADPWCHDAIEPVHAGQPVFIAVRYAEFPARPVRVQPSGCGCDASSCEYSRWRDGYEICTLDACPASHQTPPDLARLTRGHTRECPDCPKNPWVVLARVSVDADGKLTVDNCDCRRHVISFAHFWWKCTDVIDHG